MDGSIYLGSVGGPLGVRCLVVSYGVIGGRIDTKPKAAVEGRSPHAEACTLRKSHI